MILHLCHGIFPMKPSFLNLFFRFVLFVSTRASLVPCLALRRYHLCSVSYVPQTTRLLPRSAKVWLTACRTLHLLPPPPPAPPPNPILSLSLLVLPFGGGDKLSRALGRLKSKTEPNCGYRWTNNEFCYELCFICIFVWVLRQFCLFWNSRRPYFEFTLKVKVQGF